MEYRWKIDAQLTPYRLQEDPQDHQDECKDVHQRKILEAGCREFNLTPTKNQEKEKNEGKDLFSFIFHIC